MAFVPPQHTIERIAAQNKCPYFVLAPSGEPTCAASDVLGEYLPGMQPAGLGDTCLDVAGNWFDCAYFKRAKLL